MLPRSNLSVPFLDRQSAATRGSRTSVAEKGGRRLGADAVRQTVQMDLNRLSSSDEESPPLTPPAQPAQATPPAPNASADQTLPQPRYPAQPPHPPSTAQQPPQSSGSLLCQELLSVCNNDYAAQQLSAARKTSDPLTPMSPPGQNARLLAPPATSGLAGASKPDPVQLKLQAGLLQAGVPEAKRVRQVKAAERLQPKISPPALDVLKMLQVLRGESPDLPARMPAGGGRRFRRSPRGAHATH